MNKCLLTVSGLCLCVGMLYAGVKKGATARPFIPDEHAPVPQRGVVLPDPPPAPHGPALVGTYTTLGGYYDYQANGTPQHIRVNPANGNIHVTYMTSTDSTNPGGIARRTVYAFSTNGGATWNNFNNLFVPQRRSGFPSIDLLQGSNAGLPAIGNHSVVTTQLQSTLFVDSPEGAGAFSEINAPPSFGSSDEPIWPYVIGPSDGSLVFHSSRLTARTNHLNRTTDFSSWQYPNAPWFTFTGPNGSGGRNPGAANATGRVGTLVNATGPTAANPDYGGLYLFESTDNGATWGSPITVHPPMRITGADTFAVWVSVDMTYDDNTPLVALNTSRFDLAGGGYFYADARIDFWSPTTGLVTAVPHDTALFVSDMNNHAQSNHLTLGGPSICKSGSSIVIVFQAFQRDTAPTGVRYSDVWYVKSTNNGVTWSRPVNITNTPAMDERYPTVSKYNQPGFVNIVWQEDLYPGSWVISPPDPGALPARANQVFYRLNITTDVGEPPEVASSFRLEQNYPNPFNPSTTIRFQVPSASFVTLKVHNVLGQEVATIVNDDRTAGSYEVVFSADNLPSGVYYYTLKGGTTSITKKMVLMR